MVRMFWKILTNEERIVQLGSTLLGVQCSAQKYKQELEKLRQRYADDLFAERQLGKALRTESRRILHDYERLRVQKGGFGLKMLMLSGLGAFLSGVLVCTVYFSFLRLKADEVAAFERFRNAHLFDYERAINEGLFREVELDLQQNLELPENAGIRPELEFGKMIVGAARRRCE
jgi:hypothetical protein